MAKARFHVVKEKGYGYVILDREEWDMFVDSDTSRAEMRTLAAAMNRMDRDFKKLGATASNVKLKFVEA